MVLFKKKKKKKEVKMSLHLCVYALTITSTHDNYIIYNIIFCLYKKVHYIDYHLLLSAQQNKNDSEEYINPLFSVQFNKKF